MFEASDSPRRGSHSPSQPAADATREARFAPFARFSVGTVAGPCTALGSLESGPLAGADRLERMFETSFDGLTRSAG